MDSTWKRVSLGQYCEVLSGHPFKSEGFTDGADDVHLIKGENVGQGEILWNISKRWPRSDTAELSRFRLVPGDVVLAMDRPWVPAGLKFAKIPASSPDAILVQRVARLRALDGLQQELLPFIIGSPEFVAYVKNIGRGVGVPHISGREIKSFTFPLPPVAVQSQIASTLSAYDDLIENNRRRMALLEESARLLYQEWFVRLRFPGREHTPLVEGIPRGWSWRPLESVCATGEGIQTGPFGSQLHQSDYSDSGVPVVMPKDLIAFRIALESIARIPESLAEKLHRHRMVAGDTVYGRRGDIGRRAFISSVQEGWICGTGCLRIRPDPAAINPRFLFDTLGSPETSGTIANRAKGATMPNLNSSVLKSVPVLVAQRRLQDLYAEELEPVARLIELLSEQNSKLTLARDVLLPRLMNGLIIL